MTYAGSNSAKKPGFEQKLKSLPRTPQNALEPGAAFLFFRPVTSPRLEFDPYLPNTKTSLIQIMSSSTLKPFASHRFITALVAAVGVAGIATSVKAAIYTVTVTGTLSGAYDNAGIFGPAKTWLNGQAFTIIYTVTEPLLGTTTIQDSSTQRSIVGVDASNPVLGTLTVNGLTRQVKPLEGRYYFANDYASFAGAPVNDVLSFDARSDDFDGGTYYDDWISFSATDSTHALLNSTAIPAALSYTIPGPLAFAGNFRFQNSAAGYLASGDFTPTSFSIVAVPEPSTLAMTLSGLSLGLFMLRRRSA